MPNREEFVKRHDQGRSTPVYLDYVGNKGQLLLVNRQLYSMLIPRSIVAAYEYKLWKQNTDWIGHPDLLPIPESMVED